MKPVFKHDCNDPDCCRFVVHKKGKDIYTYNEGKGFLIRYGDDPCENSTYDFYTLLALGVFDAWIN